MKIHILRCNCIIGFHEECLYISEDGTECCCPSEDEIPNLIPSLSTRQPGELKHAEDVRDPKSTGRKRAVLVKKIEDGDVCEWAGLAKAGGGHAPVVGCVGNPARHVHHGPNKSTLDNRLENLHKICHNCHVRWHSLNDPFYGPDTPNEDWLPEVYWVEHDPETKATMQEILDMETYWATPKEERKSYERYVNAPGTEIARYGTSEPI